MLSPLLTPLRYEDPDLLDLIHFLRSALPRSALSCRKWRKPVARYEKLWKWCIWILSIGRFRSQFIVTRTAIILRVPADDGAKRLHGRLHVRSIVCAVPAGAQNTCCVHGTL